MQSPLGKWRTMPGSGSDGAVKPDAMVARLEPRRDDCKHKHQNGSRSDRRREGELAKSCGRTTIPGYGRTRELGDRREWESDWRRRTSACRRSSMASSRGGERGILLAQGRRFATCGRVRWPSPSSRCDDSSHEAWRGNCRPHSSRTVITEACVHRCARVSRSLLCTGASTATASTPVSHSLSPSSASLPTSPDSSSSNFPRP